MGAPKMIPGDAVGPSMTDVHKRMRVSPGFYSVETER